MRIYFEGYHVGAVECAFHQHSSTLPRAQLTNTLDRATCLAAAPIRDSGELCFPRQGIAQRRSPLKVRGRLLELRCRARPRFPSTITPTRGWFDLHLARRLALFAHQPHQHPHGQGHRGLVGRPHRAVSQLLLLSVSHLNDQFDQSLLHDSSVGASSLKRGHSGEQGGLRDLMRGHLGEQSDLRGGERLHLALHTGELLMLLLPLLLLVLLQLIDLLLLLLVLQPQLLVLQPQLLVLQPQLLVLQPQLLVLQPQLLVLRPRSRPRRAGWSAGGW